jgi:DNA-binding transcriptional ArsR family regulator
MPAGVLAEHLGVAPTTLSFHLAQLLQAGLVTQRRRSRQLIYAAEYETMNGLIAYLTENCCGRGSASAACPAPSLQSHQERKHGIG